MEKSNTKILEILAILIKYSSESNPISTTRIIDLLAEKNIKLERKAIYRYLNALKDYGYEIISSAYPKGYFLVDYSYDLQSAKFLTDIVAASSFLTKKKSQQLIDLILRDLNSYDEEIIRNQLIFQHQKSNNEQILYNIDKLLRAIAKKTTINFKYFDLGKNKEKIYRNKNYNLLPLTLVYEENKYYLITYNFKYQSYTHLRIDKMEDIVTLNQVDYKDSGLNEYLKLTFSMFASDSLENISLKVKKNKLQLVYDAIASDIIITKENADYFM